MMPGKLRGNVAIVSGAARGIGLTVAQDLVREGVDVCGTDLRADLLTEEMDRIAAGCNVQTIVRQSRLKPRFRFTASMLEFIGQQ